MCCGSLPVLLIFSLTRQNFALSGEKSRNMLRMRTKFQKNKCNTFFFCHAEAGGEVYASLIKITGDVQSKANTRPKTRFSDSEADQIYWAHMVQL